MPRPQTSRNTNPTRRGSETVRKAKTDEEDPSGNDWGREASILSSGGDRVLPGAVFSKLDFTSLCPASRDHIVDMTSSEWAYASAMVKRVSSYINRLGLKQGDYIEAGKSGSGRYVFSVVSPEVAEDGTITVRINEGPFGIPAENIVSDGKRFYFMDTVALFQDATNPALR